MTKKELCSKIDHTLLKPASSADDFLRFADEAVPYHFASLCVNPWAVGLVRKHIRDSDSRIATVIGFPNGISSPDVKLYETQKAIDSGADEIDFVINIGLLKSCEYTAAGNEISLLKQACGDHILKCIIETCLLTDEEKVIISHIIEDNGGDFVKTSTGFGGGGATITDIRLIKSSLRISKTCIKASGGIRTLDNALSMIEAGADRIGTSNGIGIVTQLAAE